MKKQYLIGILGIAAISIPMGNSLLSAGNSSFVSPQTETGEPKNTGITITEESQILVSSQDESDAAKKGDEVIGFTFITDPFDESIATPDLAPNIKGDGTGLHFYYGSDKTAGNQDQIILEFTQLNDLNEARPRENIFSLEVNKEDADAKDFSFIGKNIKDPSEVIVTMDTLYSPLPPASKAGSSSPIEGETPLNGNIPYVVEPNTDPKATSPVIDSHEAIYDDTNKILKVEGEITTNNSDITDIVLNDGQEDISADYELGEPDSTITVASYSVWAFDVDLSEPDPAEITPFRGESGFTIDGYKLIVSSEIENTGNKDVEYSFTSADDVETGDLGYLIDSGDKDDGSDKMGAGAVIGIIIAVLLVVGIIGYGGYYLYKKNVASKD